MSILKGSASITQFKVDRSQLDPSVTQSGAMAVQNWVKENLLLNAFKIDDEIFEQRLGWIGPYDQNDVGFEIEEDYVCDPYYSFQFRIDERKYPKAALKNMVSQACKKWLSENEKFKFIPKERKSEIREIIESKLIRQSIPTPTTFDIVWNSETDVLWVGTHNNKRIEMFIDLFQKSFEGLKLDLIHPLMRSGMVCGEELQGKIASLDESTTDNVLDKISDNVWLGREFLLGLVNDTMDGESDYLINQGSHYSSEGFVAFVDNRISLADVDDDGKKKIVITGVQDKFTEVKAALDEQKYITDATVNMVSGDDKWKVNIIGDTFQFKGIKTPKIEVDKDDTYDPIQERQSFFYIRIGMIENCFKMFDSLLCKFIEQK